MPANKSKIAMMSIWHIDASVTALSSPMAITQWRRGITENATMRPKHITLNALYSLALNLSVSDMTTVVMPRIGMIVEYTILK